MPKLTVQDKLCQGLSRLGNHRVPAKTTNRYIWYSRKFSTKLDHKPTYYFVGPNGALRAGPSPSKSIALSEPFRAKVLAASELPSHKI